MTDKTREFRVGGVDFRADSESGVIAGYAAVFNSPTLIGNSFREQIAPGAFSDSLAQKDDVRALIDHDPRLILGRSSAGTLRMSEDQKGLRVEIDLPDTTIAQDLRKSMDRGDVDQMSFGFRTILDEWDESQDVPTRTLRSVSLFDVSVVTYPAYPDTSAAVRSLEAQRPNRGEVRMARLRMKRGLDLRKINQGR